MLLPDHKLKMSDQNFNRSDVNDCLRTFFEQTRNSSSAGSNGSYEW